MRSSIAILLVFLSQHAAAMSCFTPPLEERFKASRHVALVEVIEAVVEESQGFARALPGTSEQANVTVERVRREPQWRKILAKVRILESYKGADTPTAITLTTWDRYPEVAVGGTFLLFLDGPELSLDCEGMPRISTGQEDEQLIDEVRALAGRRPN